MQTRIAPRYPLAELKQKIDFLLAANAAILLFTGYKIISGQASGRELLLFAAVTFSGCILLQQRNKLRHIETIRRDKNVEELSRQVAAHLDTARTTPSELSHYTR